MDSKLLISLILVAVIVLIIFTVLIAYGILNPIRKQEEKKIMYEECKNNCGTGLTCDYTGVCKIPRNSNCATNDDCTGDLSCVNWICTDSKDGDVNESSVIRKKTKKIVTWM